MSVHVVVLAGGQSRRFGSDKLAARLGEATVLDTLLSALPAQWPVIVVGPERPVCRPVTFAREDPPGGGPLAGIAAAVELLPHAATMLVLAGDLPGAGAWAPRLVEVLAGCPEEVAAVAAADGEGFANPLLAAYRVTAVRAVLPDHPADKPAKLLLRELTHRTLPAPEPVTTDVDTPEALAAFSAAADRQRGCP